MILAPLSALQRASCEVGREKRKKKKKRRKKMSSTQRQEEGEAMKMN